jgi:hypothetical protein
MGSGSSTGWSWLWFVMILWTTWWALSCVAQATQATRMLISVQYEGSWACAVNGRMCTHFVHPEGHVAPPAPDGCCHLLHDLVGLVPEG